MFRSITYLIVSGLLLSLTAVAQPNPARPDLRQGAYFSEAEGASQLANVVGTYPTRAAWEKRATLLRQGLRDGMELPERPAFAP